MRRGGPPACAPGLLCALSPGTWPNAWGGVVRACRIKKMMQTDEDVGKIAQATPVLIGAQLLQRGSLRQKFARMAHAILGA